jgi:hypothetical protein
MGMVKIGKRIYHIADHLQKELLESVDSLGLALADKNHKWSNEERKNYEKAIKILTAE